MAKISRIAHLCTMGFIAALLAVGTGRAQVLYGTLTGNVTDPVGAAIPKAQVEATNQDTNVKHAAETDDHGVYRFTDLQPGMYRVRVTMASFKTFIEDQRRGAGQRGTPRGRATADCIGQRVGGSFRRCALVLQTDKAISIPRSRRRKWNNCRITARKARTSRRCCSCNLAPRPLPAPAKPIRPPATRSAPSRCPERRFLAGQ